MRMDREKRAQEQSSTAQNQVHGHGHHHRYAAHNHYGCGVDITQYQHMCNGDQECMQKEASQRLWLRACRSGLCQQHFDQLWNILGWRLEVFQQMTCGGLMVNHIDHYMFGHGNAGHWGAWNTDGRPWDGSQGGMDGSQGEMDGYHGDWDGNHGDWDSNHGDRHDAEYFADQSGADQFGGDQSGADQSGGDTTNVD